MKRVYTNWLVVVFFAMTAMSGTGVILVGGSTLNGDFNANPGSKVDFANTSEWVNIVTGLQTAVATRNNLVYDGTQNAVIPAGANRVFGLNTGYTITEGDVFDISYVWRDAWSWVGASDRIRVALFVTDNNTLTGVRTDLVVDLSETSTLYSTYETVDHDGIYTVAAADAGKTLFVAIDGNNSGSGGFARLDNFELIAASQAQAVTFYVDADVPGSNDGISWPNAFNHLQDAIAAASSGDSIWVAEGIYRPDQGAYQIPSDRNASFHLKNAVQIKGGFAGYGTADPNENDPGLYPVILSGDLNGDDGPDFNNNCDNSYHVVTGSKVIPSASLDGFTITAGNANGFDPYDRGGGMLNLEGSPTVANCTFTGNWSGDGGAMYNGSGNPTLTNCTLNNNSSQRGGGAMNNYKSSPTLTNCTLSGNSAGWGGGGINNVQESSPKVTNCTFSNNSAGWDGGGINNNRYSSPTLTNCILWGNSGPQIFNNWSSSASVNYSDVQGGWPVGGNIDTYTGFIGPEYTGTIEGLIAHWTFDENQGTTAFDSVDNNHGTIYGAQWTAGKIGSALSFDGVDDYVNCGNDTSLDITNEFTIAAWICPNSISDEVVFLNKGSNGCGNYNLYIRDGELALLSSDRCHWNNRGINSDIVINRWQHIVGTFDGYSIRYYIDSLLTDVVSADGVGAYNNHDLKIGGTTVPGWYLTEFFRGAIDDVRIYDRALSAEEILGIYEEEWIGIGNIDADPLFVDAGNGDFRLLPDSPCIDAGCDAGVYEDIEGNIRPWDFPGVDNNGEQPEFDIGAYEYMPTIEVIIKLTPRTLNCRSKGNWVKAHLTLPEGFTVSDLDTDRPAVLHSFGFESAPLNVFVNENELVEIEAAFRREDICSLANDWPESLTIYGFFSDGNIFFGTSTVRIITPGTKEIAELASYWLLEDCEYPDWCDGIDINRDSIVNLVDYHLMLNSQVEFISE